MARQHLLTGQITGRVGSFVGSKNASGAYVKARVFSKETPTTAQQEAITAFGCLQRFSVAVAKRAVNYRFSLIGNGTWQNIVCHAFKKMVTGRTFTVENAALCFPTVDTYSLTISSFSQTSSTLTVSLSFPSTAIAKKNRHLLIIVFNNTMNEASYDIVNATATTANFQWQSLTIETPIVFSVEMIENSVENFPYSANRAKHPYIWRNVAITS